VCVSKNFKVASSVSFTGFQSRLLHDHHLPGVHKYSLRRLPSQWHAVHGALCEESHGGASD